MSNETITIAIDRIQPTCTGDEHVFVIPVPRKRLDYAAPPGLRCQCGEVEYWRAKKARPAGDSEDAE
jgi:hypothetical protein